MRLPDLVTLLVLCGASRLVEASEPLNLFRPDTGQRTTFVVRDAIDGKPSDSTSYWITALSGDTANYRFLFFRNQSTGNYSFAWSQGRLTAPLLLKARTLDTNGIYSRRKTFPADFSMSTATNRSHSGYTLQHVVDGFLFDTLLVACQYELSTDGGDNCDFITPSGVLVYSNVITWSRYRVMPDAATLAALGGKPVPSAVVRKARRKAVPALWLTDGFDIRGRLTRAAPAGASIPSPGR